VYFTYNHEPEAAASSAMGDDTQFIAAWRNVYNIFQADNVTNAKFLWIMTAYAFNVKTTDARYAWKWYPGDAYVDAIASDAYNEYNCRYSTGPWTTFAQAISGFVTFGSQHPTKPMYLAEFASVEDTKLAGRKAQWITDAENLLQQPAYSQIVGVSYFNQTRPGTACDWHIQTSTSATNAFIAMANDPYFSGTVDVGGSPPSGPDAAFTSQCTQLSCTFDGSGSSGTGLSYAWTFGDGATSTAAKPSHTYGTGDTYTVALTVTDSSNNTDSVTHSVTVTNSAGGITFVGAVSTTANSTKETVKVPTAVKSGNGLVLIATNASPAAMTAPTGWTSVASTSSKTMYSTVWQKVAGSSDAGSTVTVTFPGTDKGSVELLAYSGTSATGPVSGATGATVETTVSSLKTPVVNVTSSGSWLVSYWAPRTSSDTEAITPPSGQVVRSSESGTGGGKITSMSTDGGAPVPTGSAGGLTAKVNPASGHSADWSIVLASA
jgi:PKD repeat protein